MENNLDGSVDLYDALTADNPVSNKYFDAENFYPATGKTKRKKRRAGGFFQQLLANQREKNRMKFAAKDKLAQAQIESAKASQKGVSADIALAKSLGKTSSIPAQKPEKQGMSTTTKILIGVGVLAVLGIGAYFLLKKKKK